MQLKTAQIKIADILKELPPEKQDEVLDFAEYLKTKGEPARKPKGKKRPLKLPAFHLGHIEKGALDREAMYGESLSRKLD